MGDLASTVDFSGEHGAKIQMKTNKQLLFVQH